MPLSERWFRTNPDSSTLERPRLLARSLISVTDLDDHAAFYQRLLGVPADLRMPIPDFGGLELVAVGGLLLIASERPFTPMQMLTAYSLIVPSLDDGLERLQLIGATVLEPRAEIVPGARARVRYADGAVAELVEHRPRPGEQPARRPGGTAGVPPATGVRLFARRAIPHKELDAAVAHYESALERQVTARAKPCSPGVAELAIVGNLLLVGLDEAGPEDREPIAFALLAPPLAGLGSRPGTGAEGDDRTVVTLATGARAEVWDERAVPF
jgi:hypothetical protein